MQHALRRLQEAERSFAQAIALKAAGAEARSARATVLAELGRYAESEAELRAAIAEFPGNAQAHHNLGVLLSHRGNAAEALTCYDCALSIDPAHTAARRNRASLRLARLDAEGALEDYAHLAGEPEAAAGRVRALLLLQRDDEALREAQRLAAQHPGDPLVSRLNAISLASLGRFADAEEALAAAGEAAGARALYIDRGLERQQVCDWRDRERLVVAVREALAQRQPGELADPAAYFHLHALPLRGDELKQIGARVAAGIHARAVDLRGHVYEPQPGERLRIGFMSSGIREHTEAWLLRRVLTDRDRTRFEYFVYALSADDGSKARGVIAASADRFVDCSTWQVAQIVQHIRNDRLHLLVDLSGNLEGSRPEVLAARVAPLQANFIGPPCTLGPDLYDYRFSDAVATPPASQADWHEHFVLLPAPHWTYDCAQPIGESGTRATHGLPENGVVFGCFHQPFKISPELLEVWLRLLKRIPGSVLWLLEGGRLARRNLLERAQLAGVDPARLVFAPRVPLLEAHLGRQRHADLFLDTLYYGAQTTAADALHVGVPVLTCAGRTMASRLCASFVQGAGIPDMVVPDLATYEARAADLASDPMRLNEVRERLARARTTAPFFATEDRVRALERAFAAMVERHRAGLPPAMMRIR